MILNDQERGTVTVPDVDTVPLKGPLNKVILPCSTLIASSGQPKLVFGLPRSMITPLVLKEKLFCDTGTFLNWTGLSRVFSGVECDGNHIPNMKQMMVLNQKVYLPVPGDNLLVLPDEVFFVEEEAREESTSLFTDRFVEILDEETIRSKLGKFIDNEEVLSFALEHLKV